MTALTDGEKWLVEAFEFCDREQICRGNWKESMQLIAIIRRLDAELAAHNRPKGFLKTLNEQGSTFIDTEDMAQLDVRTGKRFGPDDR